MNHADARTLIEEGFRRCYGVRPSLSQAQCLQAIGWLETNYGEGWSDKVPGAAGSNNWGAITAGTEWYGSTFEHRDSRPDASGNNIWYTTRFRRYSAPIDGATDLANIVYLTRDKAVLSAAEHGATLAFSTALYNTGYYKGFGATPDERITRHHAAVQSAIALQCKALNEPPPYLISDAELARLAAEAADYCRMRQQNDAWLLTLDADLDGHGAANLNGAPE